MRKAGAKDYTLYSKSILNVCGNKPISFEVFADDYSSILRQALIINSWGKNVFVKVPVVNSKGKFMGKIIQELNKRNIKINVTAVYTSAQTEKIIKLINKKTKVIISIFAGRAADTGKDPIPEIKKSINESAATAKKVAENNVDSVVVGLATKVVITALSGIATKGFSFINDDIKYKNMIDRTWEMLPLPIRLLGKDVINYDDNMYFLRKKIFGKDKDEPEVDSEDESIVSRTIKKMFS